ncbi:hypothetical protein BDZ89DRAFT_1131229 [Hymenopellis radicata]|nr:hypothetical protein BDZ89DRAFT_1131229 [Hymenopellis radicata]
MAESRVNGLLANPVVLPLATWFVKKQVERMLEGVIKAAVEEIGSLAQVVAVETKENKKSMWSAITHPTVSLWGVQMDIAAEGEEPDTTAALAVGVVPQLLPAKDEPAPLESPSGMYERAVDEIHVAEERVVGEVRKAEVAVREGAGTLREEMDDAPERVGSEVATVERICGWRSDAFGIA